MKKAMATTPKTSVGQFRDLLQAKLVAKNKKQKDLAKELGRRESTVSMWLSDRKPPAKLDPRTEKLVAKFLGVTTKELRAVLRDSQEPSTAPRPMRRIDSVKALHDLFDEQPRLDRHLGPLNAHVDLVAVQRMFAAEGFDVSTDILERQYTRDERGLVRRLPRWAPRYLSLDVLLNAFQSEYRRVDEIRDVVRAVAQRLNVRFEEAGESLPISVLHELIASRLPTLGQQMQTNIAHALVEHMVRARLLGYDQGVVGRHWHLRPEYIVNNLFGVSTQIDGLDFLLDGGLLPPTETGSATLIRGLPGSGKTVLGMNIAAAFAAQGHLAVYLSVEEDTTLLLGRLSFLGYDVRREGIDFSAVARRGDARFVVKSMTNVENTGAADADLLKPSTLILLSTLRGGPTSAGDAVLDAVERLLQRASRSPDGDDNRGHHSSGQALNTKLEVCLVIDSVDALIEHRTRAAYDRMFNLSRKPGVFGFYLAQNDSRQRPHIQDYVADTVIALGYRRTADIPFIERIIEIRKCRTQHHLRGEHTCAIRTGEGMVVFPSVQAKLSIWRARVRVDRPAVPVEWRLDSGFDLNSVMKGDVVEGSSLLLVGPPATHKFPIGLSFLASETEGDSLLISLREDQPAVLRIVAAYSQMARLAGEGPMVSVPGSGLAMLYFPPDYFTAAVFLERIERWLRHSKRDEKGRKKLKRVLFNNLNQLSYNSPMFSQEKLFIPALIELFRKERVTSLFIQVSDSSSNTDVGNIFDVIMRLEQGKDSDHVQLQVSHSGPCNADRRPHTVQRGKNGILSLLPPGELSS